MTYIRFLVVVLCLWSTQLLAVTGNINVQFLLSNADTGTMEGQYKITFSILLDEKHSKDDALWKETHDVFITQGKVSRILGEKLPINYHDFKSDEVYLKLDFAELEDSVTVPLISVPAAVVSKYAEYAKELEYTSDWLKVNTVNYRVGIGITQNLTVPFQVVGSANITSVNATEELHSPDGFNVHQLDYLKLVNLDDYSLSPYDAPTRTDNNEPIRDVVFITGLGNVGVGIDVTADITEQLHVSGNLKVDKHSIKGNSNIELAGSSLQATGTYDGKKQLIWNSQKGFFRAGEATSGQWSVGSSGLYSVAFGIDNIAGGDNSVSAGGENTVNGKYSIGFGQTNTVKSDHSAILSGKANKIESTIPGFSIIGGGFTQLIESNYSFIGGGHTNKVLVGAHYSAILGGKLNTIQGGSEYSSILGGQSNVVNGDYSYAAGRNAKANHSGVFIFSDNSDAANFESYQDNQFMIRAKNGVVVGLSNTNLTTPRDILNDQANRKFPKADNSRPLRDHSIWSKGDIVAAQIDGSGQLDFGYLVGDGTYITNISSLWSGDSTYNSIYTDDKRIGIGANNDASPKDSSLYIKETSEHPAQIKLESDDTPSGTMHFGVETDGNGTSFIDTNQPLSLKIDTKDVAKTTSDEYFYVVKRLGVGEPNPSKKLEVAGDSKFSGDLEIGSNITVDESEGKVTATAFEGDGSELKNVPVWYMTPDDGAPARQLILHDDGRVGIGDINNGTATNSNVKALLHIGQDSTDIPQIRIEDTDDGDDRHVSISSSDHFELTFHNADTSTTTKANSPIIEFKKDSTNLMVFSAKGHVGIGKDPDPNKRLDVNGAVKGGSFHGEGHGITKVQLDTAQSNPVTFSNTVTISEAIQLNTQSSSPCDAPGKLFTVSDGSGVALCFCSAANTEETIFGSANICDFP